MPAPDPGGPYALTDILEIVGLRLGFARAGATGALWARWAEIVGPAVAAHAEPTSLRHGVLRVRATSPVWATELVYLSTTIAARANELTAPRVVTEVRIWTGPGPVQSTRTTRPSRSSDPRPGPRMVAPADRDPNAALERAKEAWRRTRGRRA
jgi:predicted nucleic acid-binding Zn ribbon protein